MGRPRHSADDEGQERGGDSPAGADPNALPPGVAEYVPETDGWITFGSGMGPGERGVRHVAVLPPNPLSGVWVRGTFNTAGGAPGCSLALWGRSNLNG